MVVSVETVMSILYFLIGWCTLSTVALILARRDVVLGLKKWFFLRTRKSPLKLRFHGADKTVTSQIIPTKGKGEAVTIGDKKMFFFKTKEGSTFFLDEACIRRGDDGVNEISYNYKSIMPLNPDLSEVEAEAARKDLIERIKVQKENKDATQGAVGVNMENLAQYTDPRRLNRLIEFIKLAAKTEALGRMTDLEKYVKWTLYAAGASVVLGVLIWYTLDNKMIPQLANILQAVQSVGSTVLNL